MRYIPVSDEATIMAQLDIPKFIRRLRAGGVTEEVAMVHAEAVQGVISDGFASKSDLDAFAHDLLSELNHVRDRLNDRVQALEEKITAIGTDLKTDMRIESLALENRLLLKLGAMLVAVSTVQVGVPGILLAMK